MSEKPISQRRRRMLDDMAEFQVVEYRLGIVDTMAPTPSANAARPRG